MTDIISINQEKLTFRLSRLNGFSKLSVVAKSLVVLSCHSDVVRVVAMKSFYAAAVLPRYNFSYPQPVGTLRILLLNDVLRHVTSSV